MTAYRQESVDAVRVQGLSKRFGNVVALDSVTFTVAAGEFFFLLGPSGCGKTTLLRILAGLESADAGRVYARNLDVTSLPAHKREIPLVFQNYALWPHMTVRDNIAFGLVERGRSRTEIAERVCAALQQVGMAGLGERHPGELSGGQQQRVALARALVVNPSIILMDEPLSNLDAKLRAEMREELARLHAETDITFIFVTHDQTEALSLADRIVLLREGRLMATGPPRELYHRPPNLFCADFLGDANLVEGEVARCKAGERLEIETPFGSWEGITAATAPFRPGQSVYCVVRPESLHTGAGRGSVNRVSGRVIGSRMAGATVNLDLESENIVLRASLLNAYRLSLETGAQEEWFVRPEDTVVVARGGAPVAGRTA